MTIARPAIVRLSDWEHRFAAYLAEVADKPFAWGSHDCALFAAGAVLAITGVDPAAKFRGKYRSAAGSVRALRDIGAGTLESTVDALFDERPCGFARRGDVVMFAGSLGVCIGNDALFVGEERDAGAALVSEGLQRIERSLWDKSWAIG